MKDGLYQYKYGNVCAGFVVRNGAMSIREMAPILRSLLTKQLRWSQIWERSKWIAPNENTNRNRKSSSRNSSK